MESRGSAACHGRLTVSMASHGGEGNPVISEEGRQFLFGQLQRLTPAHVRALFTAARVDVLGDGSGASKPADVVLDEWVKVFQEKVQEIGARHCQPAS